MEFAEPDKARHIGTKPGHGGTQIFKEAAATDDTTIIHTVTTGKTLYLCWAGIGYGAVAAGVSILFIRSDTDALIAAIFREYVQAATSGKPSHTSIWPPLEVPEKYDIVIVSGAAGLTVRGAIFGWEE